MNGDPGDPEASGAAPTSTTIRSKQSNKRGFVTFAKTGAPNSRSTQIFINYGDNRASTSRASRRSAR